MRQRGVEVRSYLVQTQTIDLYKSSTYYLLPIATIVSIPTCSFVVTCCCKHLYDLENIIKSEIGRVLIVYM